MSVIQPKPFLVPTPEDSLPSGVASKEDKNVPTLFTPLTVRGLTLHNRFVVSPMGTWSAVDGHLTDFHLVHLGTFALRGVALTMVESTIVSANGRTSVHDSGIWKDSHILPQRRVVDFIHAQGQKVGIQLNHAGQRSGMQLPWASGPGGPTVASEQEGGWPDDIWGPSARPNHDAFASTKALTLEKIDGIVRDFAQGAKRAVQAGFDIIEIHGAHGYLIHQFLSPVINKRTDEYGGSFENRIRFATRVIRAVRGEMPSDMPLSLRISGTDWMEHTAEPSWDISESVKFAKLLPSLGVDILDVSSGGNIGHASQKIPSSDPRYQINLAADIRAELRRSDTELLVAAVGHINTPEITRDLLQSGEDLSSDDRAKNLEPADADLVFIGKQFLKEPEFVLRSAYELGVDVTTSRQLSKGSFGHGKR